MSCKVERKSYLDSYEVALDGVKRENPALTDHDARVRTAEMFRPRYRQWVAAARVENSGQKEYVNGEFAINERGEMYFPNTGETAEGFHINQKRLSELHRQPGEYSHEDHQLTRLIQATLNEGATRVVTSFSRNDGKNRDVLEYTYDPVTNKGSIRVLNTESGGTLHSYNEIKQQAVMRFSGLNEISPSEHMFVLSDKPVPHTYARQVIESVGHSAARPVRETRFTVRAVSSHNEMRVPYHIPQKTPEHISRDPRVKDVRPGFLQSLKDRFPRVRQRRPAEVFPQKERNVRKKSGRKETSGRAETRLLYSAAGKIKKEALPEQRMKSAVAKSIARHEKKMIKKGLLRESRAGLIKKPEPDRRGKIGRADKKVRLPVMPERRIRTGERPVAQKRKRVSQERRVLFSRKKTKERMRIAPAEKQMIRYIKVLRERAVIRRKADTLFTQVRKFIRIKERLLMRKYRKSERSKMLAPEQTMIQHEHMLDFSLAFMYFLILRISRRIPKYGYFPHKGRENVRTGRIDIQETIKGRYKKADALLPAERTPWILLAIIWHLAMIRESGLVSTTAAGSNTPVRKKPVVKKRFTGALPPQGVIFARGA